MKAPRIGTYILKGDLTLEEKLKITQEAGFDFICCGYNTLTADEGKIVRLCDKMGLPIDNTHLNGPKTNFIWGKDALADEICERYCREIAGAAALGIKRGIVHVTWGKKTIPDDPGEIGFARYEKIREAAEKNGFTVCIENSIFPNHFYSVLDRFDCPEFKHCFDCGHKNAFTPDIPIIEKYGNRLAATHIHDNDGEHDLHILPFDGTADWNWLAEQYASFEFSRDRICSEFGGTHSYEFDDCDEAAARECVSKMKIDPKHVRFDGNVAYFYENMSYEELNAILYERMSRLASMVAKSGTKKGL